MAAFVLRDYQLKSRTDLRSSFAHGHRKMLLQAPTGAGKTVIASEIIKGANEKGSGCLFFAHRRELVYQVSDKLHDFGVEHGMIMSGEFADSFPGVQVASVDTFRARVMQRKKMRWPGVKVVVIDEAHRSLSPTYMKIIEHYHNEGAVILGLTATPIRGDGKGLDNIYDDLVCTPNVQELINMKHLVPPVYFAPTVPDLTGVRTKMGDYDKTQLEEAMDQNALVGDIVENWLRLGRQRQTIVFASGVHHSIHLRDRFRLAGVRAEHIDGTTPPAERDGIIRDLRKGLVEVICNCMVLTEGFDHPPVSCIVLARPTKNYGLYVQMAGRGLRPCEDINKQDCLILDHSGAIYRHGKVNDPYIWTLDGKALSDADEKRQRRVRIKTTITCVMCAAVYQNQLKCPQCGHVPEKQGKYVETRHGDLVMIMDAKEPAKSKQWSRQTKVEWFNMFLKWADEKGFKRGWAHHKYREKFEVWPARDFPEFDLREVPFTDEFKAYMKSRAIAYSAAMKKKEKEQREREEAAQRDQEQRQREMAMDLEGADEPDGQGAVGEALPVSDMRRAG